LKFLELAPIPQKFRGILIRTIVLPIFTWCAAISPYGQSMLDHLRVAAHKAFTGRVLTDTPFPIKCELMGWAADPKVACLHMALRFAVRIRYGRIHVKGNAWLHMMGLPSKKWYHFTPVLTSFRAQQRWTVHPSGDFIQRTDSYGHLRTWHLGVVRLCIVFEWIANVFRAEFLQKSKRIFGVYKRHQEEGLARGRDDLPPLQGAGFCTFAGHKQFLTKPHCDKFHMHAAFATGCSFWCYTAGQSIQQDDPRTLCLCGAPYPSRPHLVWNCEAFAPLRNQVPAPVNLVEERLLAKVVFEQPKAPAVGPWNAVVDNFFTSVCNHVPSLDTMFVATDGSEQNGIAAWSAFWPQFNLSLARGVEAEDQSAFRAEVDVIISVLELLRYLAARRILPRSGTVLIISDCRSAIDVATSCGGQCPRLSLQYTEIIRHLRSLGMYVEFAWIPSRGKHSPLFQPSPLCAESDMRLWNDTADRQAELCMRRLLAAHSGKPGMRNVKLPWSGRFLPSDFVLRLVACTMST